MKTQTRITPNQLKIEMLNLCEAISATDSGKISVLEEEYFRLLGASAMARKMLDKYLKNIRKELKEAGKL